jgi:hypothetical protein
MRYIAFLFLMSCQPAAQEEAAPANVFTSKGLEIIADDERPVEGLPFGLTFVAVDSDGFRDPEARGRVALQIEGDAQGVPANLDFTAAHKGVIRIEGVTMRRTCAVSAPNLVSRKWDASPDLSLAKRPTRRGDVNADGKIDEADHKIITEIARTRRFMVGAEILAADIDENGSVTPLDTASGIPPTQKPVKASEIRIVAPTSSWVPRNKFVLVVDLPLEFKWTLVRNYVVLFSNRSASNHPMVKETRAGSNLLRACEWASPQGERVKLQGRRLTVDLSGLLRPGPQTVTIAATNDVGAISYASWTGTVGGVEIAGRLPLLCAVAHVPPGSQPTYAWKVEGQSEVSYWKHSNSNWRETKELKGLFTHPHQSVTSFASAADGTIELQVSWDSAGIHSDRATLPFTAR